MKPAKFTLAAVATASALALSGCVGASPAPAPTPENVELRMTVWTSNEDQLALFDAIADEYMAEHPEVTSITFDPLPFADYTSTLTTQIAGGKAPDLAWIFENAAPDFVGSAALYDIQSVLEKTEGYELDDLNDSATALWRTSEGDLAAYPFSTSPLVAFVNEDLLAAAGLPSSAEIRTAGDWNWETVSEFGSAVNAATGEAGFALYDYANWQDLASVWIGWGAAPWSEDGLTCTFDTPEMVEAFEFIHDAAFTAKSMPGPGTTADFFAGESAFTFTQISRASLLAEGGFAWDVLPLPEGPEGQKSIVGQAGIGVMKQGTNPAVAADFLAFFTNPTNSAKLAQYFPPPRNSQLNSEVLSAANPMLSLQQLEDVIVPAIETGIVRPGHTNSAQISQEVRAGLDPLWTPDADIAAVLKSVCEAIDPLLSE